MPSDEMALLKRYKDILCIIPWTEYSCVEILQKLKMISGTFPIVAMVLCATVLAIGDESIPKSASYSLNEFGSEMKKLKTHGKELELSEHALASLRRMFAHCTKLNVRNNHPSYELIIEPLKERAMNMKFKSGEPFKYAFLAEPAEAVYTISENKITGNETLDNGAKFEVEITFGNDEIIMTRSSKSVTVKLQFMKIGSSGSKLNNLIPKAATYIASIYGSEMTEEITEHGEDIGVKSVYKDALVDGLKPMTILKVKNTHPHYLIQLLFVPNDGLQFNSGEPFEYFVFGKTCKAFYTVTGNKISGKEILKDSVGHAGEEYDVEFLFNDNGNTLVMTRTSETATVKLTYIKSLI